MKAKDLLNPRYKVVGKYPNSNYSIGQTIETTSIWLEGFPPSYFDNYPNIFKKLNWWEERSIKDMPKKLKSLCSKDQDDFDIDKEEVFNIIEWNMKTLDGIINVEKLQVCSLTSWNPEYGYIPVD